MKNPPSYCLAGNILEIDLSTRRIEILKTEALERGFLGGRGVNQSLLLDSQKEGASPFDPENIIVFGAGRLVGTGAPCATRMNIDSKNVFTGGIGSSNLGGHFGRELKQAGFDHILVSGKSEDPVYLWLSDGRAEIRDARPLWGKLLSQTEEALRTSLKDEKIQFLGIGPAGENRVWTSAILGNHSRAAARCGLGAIMGDKKLKAIAVRGTRKAHITLADPEGFGRLTKELMERLAGVPSVKRKKALGTIAAVAPLNRSGAMPVRNFEDEYLSEEELAHYLPGAFDRLSVGSIHCCTPCPIDCQHGYKGSQTTEFPWDKLEANSVWDFGPRLGLTSPEDILNCHALCSQYGLDIDSTASVICWAMDCFEQGILRPSDTDGLELRWGKSEVIFELIRKIALREGIGDLLAEGSHRAALKVGKGSARSSFTIKGHDLIEPVRSCKGWALGVAVSPRGGTHTRGAPQTEFHGVDTETGKRIWGVETAGIPQEYRGKAELVIYYERFHALLDSLGLCHFVSNWSAPDLLGPREIAELCSRALGEEFSEQTLMEKGERILTLEKIYNMIQTGFRREDDDPPRPFFEEPIRRGLFAGEKLDREQWDQMLTEYYTLHGWDPRTSFPKRETLEKLGLVNYLPHLQKRGKVG